MDWLTFAQSLDPAAVEIVQAGGPAFTFVLGDTSFIIEYDEENTLLHGLGVVGKSSVMQRGNGKLLMHLLKTNMRLQSMNLGSIAYDEDEDEFVWRKHWQMEHLNSEDVLESFGQVNAMRQEMADEGWLLNVDEFSSIPQAGDNSVNKLTQFLAS